MTARYLHHVTLDTGQSRRSYRTEVSDAAVAYGRSLLTAARASGRASLVEPLAHYGLSVTIDGPSLLATVDGPAGPHVPGRPHAGPTMPLVTMAVPQRSRAAPGLWTLITGLGGYGTPPERPAAPWLAVQLHPGLNGYPEAVEWLGDFERVIAWAWIEA